MIGVGTGGLDRPTLATLTNEEWATFAPSGLRAQMYGPWYIGFSDASRGLAIPLPPMGDASVSILDRYDGISGIETDDRTGDVFVIAHNTVSQFDAQPGRRFAVTWRSKRFMTPRPINLGAIQVYFTGLDDKDTDEEEALQAAANAYNEIRMAQGPLEAIGLSVIGTGITPAGALPIDPRIAPAPIANVGGGPLFRVGEWIGELAVRATVIGNNAVRYSRLLTDSKVHKLPSGYKATEWFVELSGRGEVQKMVVAETGKECGED